MPSSLLDGEFSPQDSVLQITVPHTHAGDDATPATIVPSVDISQSLLNARSSSFSSSAPQGTRNNQNNSMLQSRRNSHPVAQETKKSHSFKQSMLSWTKILLYTCHNFTLTASLLYCLYLQLPSHISVLYPEHKDNKLDKTLVLGMVTALSSLFNAAGGLFFGFISDLTGFRSLYVFVACLVWNATMFGRVWLLDSGIILYTFLLSIGMISYAAQLSPYNALLPLLFPQSQYGVVSGLIGLTSLVGTLLGVGVFAFVFDLINEMYILLIMSAFGLTTSLLLCVLGEGSSGGRCCKRRRKRNKEAHKKDVLPDLEFDKSEILISDSDVSVDSDDSMAEIFDLDEETLKRLQSHPSRILPRFFHTLCRFMWHFPYEFIKAFKHRNFVLICMVRGAMYVALSISQTYTLYFLTDMLNNDFVIFGYNWIKTPSQALSIFMFVVIFLSLFSSVLSGILSDKFGNRKYYVFVSALLCALAQVIILVFRSFNVLLIAAFVSGIALGTFVSTDLALANDVLPSKEDAGKLLSIYTSFFSLPQLIVPPLAGIILSWGNKLGSTMEFTGLGYIFIYSISSFWAVLCAIIVLFISVKKDKMKRKQGRQTTSEDTGAVVENPHEPADVSELEESPISRTPPKNGQRFHELEMEDVELHSPDPHTEES